jgi:hypothetical protein
MPGSIPGTPKNKGEKEGRREEGREGRREETRKMQANNKIVGGRRYSIT